MIRIISSRDDFRRCNIAHSKKATDYPDDFFSEEQLQDLRKEPLLTVVEGLEDEGIVATSTKPEDMTVKELKELLDSLTVEYDPKARKDELVELVYTNTAEPPKE